MLKYFNIVLILSFLLVIKCVMTQFTKDPWVEYHECYHMCRAMNNYNCYFCSEWCGSTLPDSDSENESCVSIPGI